MKHWLTVHPQIQHWHCFKPAKKPSDSKYFRWERSVIAVTVAVVAIVAIAGPLTRLVVFASEGSRWLAGVPGSGPAASVAASAVAGCECSTEWWRWPVRERRLDCSRARFAAGALSIAAVADADTASAATAAGAGESLCRSEATWPSKLNSTAMRGQLRALRLKVQLVMAVRPGWWP